MTHAPIPVEAQLEAGIDPGGIRLALGLEEADDIIADLDARAGNLNAAPPLASAPPYEDAPGGLRSARGGTLSPRSLQSFVFSPGCRSHPPGVAHPVHRAPGPRPDTKSRESAWRGSSPHFPGSLFPWRPEPYTQGDDGPGGRRDVTEVGQATPDGEPIRRIQEGDEAAARALFERYVPALRAQVRRNMPPSMRRKVAESDMIQEAYLAAFLSLGNFEDRGEEAFRSWLAQDPAAQDPRRGQAATSAPEKRDARREQSGVGDPLAGQRRPTATPRRACRPWRRRNGRRCGAPWTGSPPTTRRSSGFVHRDGLTLTEAGTRMGRTADAARKLYGRAVARLTESLMDGGVAGA